MIRYGYTCDSCKYQFQVSLPVDERHEPTKHPCPKCGESAVMKDIGCATFILKGHCWSRDNYARVLGDNPRGHFAVQTGGDE